MNNIGWTGLIEAIWFSNNDSAHVQTVRVLIAGGADVCQRSGSGRTPLEYTQYPWIQADEIAEILIENGGDDCPE
jgi:hypothetical protein